jgi:hypothetical protein
MKVPLLSMKCTFIFVDISLSFCIQTECAFWIQNESEIQQINESPFQDQQINVSKDQNIVLPLVSTAALDPRSVWTFGNIGLLHCERIHFIAEKMMLL